MCQIMAIICRQLWSVHHLHWQILYMHTFKTVSDDCKCVGAFLSEFHQRSLVQQQQVREHVTPGCGQHIDFRNTDSFQPIETSFAVLNLVLDLEETKNTSVVEVPELSAKSDFKTNSLSWIVPYVCTCPDPILAKCLSSSWGLLCTQS